MLHSNYRTSVSEILCGVAAAPARSLLFSQTISRSRLHLTIYAPIRVTWGCSAGLFPGALPEKLILNLRQKEEAALNEDSVTISRMLILGCRIEIDNLTSLNIESM